MDCCNTRCKGSSTLYGRPKVAGLQKFAKFPAGTHTDEQTGILTYRNHWPRGLMLCQFHSGPFQNVYILDHSSSFRLWTIPKFVHHWPFKQIYTWYHSRVFFNFFFYHAWIYKICNIQEYLHSGSFKNFYILVHSRMCMFLTIPEFLHSGLFQNSYILDHSRKNPGTLNLSTNADSSTNIFFQKKN